MNHAGTVDVRAIVEELKRSGLRGVKDCSEGWRASTIFDNEKAGDASLAIYKDGGFKCFRTEKSGSVVGLYADLIGRPYMVAKRDLKNKGLIPQTYVELKTEKKEDPEKVVEENSGKLETLISSIRFDLDVAKVAAWRGISPGVISQSIDSMTLGLIDSYPDTGSAYAFICNSPPMEGVTAEPRGVMVRASLPQMDKKNRWRNPVPYPIWSPIWNSEASEVIFTEGQWDALAMQQLLEMYAPKEEFKKYQVLAFVGGKNPEKFPEIMEYLSGKIVYYVPDDDPPDSKGKNKGEEILAKTASIIEQVAKDQLLLRVLGGHNDLNDWLKAGISQDQFELWMEGKDPFRVSNGFIIDSEFRASHDLKMDSIVEVNDDGEPVEIYTGKKEFEGYLDRDYLQNIIAPFPILSEYVEESLKVLESPVIYHIQSFISYLAAISGRRFKMESGASGCLFPNMFTLLVGPSGIGKSEAMKMLMPIASKVNKKLFTSESFSAEALIDEFQEAPQKMMVAEEFSPWMQSREGSYRFWAMKNFLLMYDCHRYSDENPYVMNFRKTSKVEISNPCLTILSACTTEQIGLVNPQLLTDGTIGRFCYPSGDKKESSIPFPSRIRQDTLYKIERLFRAINGTPIRTNSFMCFSSSARMLYVAAFRKQEDIVKQIDPTRDTQTYFSRWRVQVQKVAMLFEITRPVHEVEDDKLRNEMKFRRSDLVISEESMVAALKFVDVLGRCFVDNFWGQFKKSEMLTINSKIQARMTFFMRKHSRSNGTGVTKTELARFLQESQRTFDENIEALKTQGVVFQKEIKKPGKNGKGGRGRPTIIYLLAEEKNVRPIQIAANTNYQRPNQINGQTYNAEVDTGHADAAVASRSDKLLD